MRSVEGLLHSPPELVARTSSSYIPGAILLKAI